MIRIIASLLTTLLFCGTAYAGNSSLSNLTPGAAITDTDLFYDVQVFGSGGVKVTGANLSTYLFGKASGSCTATSAGVFSCPLVVGTTVVNSATANGLLFVSSGILQNNGPIVSTISNPIGNGQWNIGGSTSLGAIIIGQGSTDDFVGENKNGTAWIQLPTGTTTPQFPGLSAGTQTVCLGLDSSNNLVTHAGACGSGGGGTPGGSNTQVQYNNSSAFGGITNLTSNGTNPFLTAIAAPASPASGFLVLYEDSTNLILTAKNASGTISNTVVPSTASAHQFATAVSGAGVVTYTQPAYSDISGTPTAGGSTTQVLFNSSGTETGDSGFTYGGTGQATLALGTITTNNKALNITGTWNAVGTTFDAPLFVNITNTASAAASLLADIQLGGTSIFSIGYKTTVGSIVNVNGGISFSGQTTFGVWDIFKDGTTIVFDGPSDNITALATGGTLLTFSFGSTNERFYVNDGNARVMSIQQTTNATGLHIYNSSDVDAGTPVNYSRGAADWTTTAGAYTVGSQKGGTGAAANLALATTRHINITGGTPTANSCAGFALATGSSDGTGSVSYTSATTCSITFGSAYTNNPFCNITPGSAASTVEVVTSTTGFTATFGTAQTAFSYQCFGV